MELGLPNLGVNSQGAAGGTVITSGSPLFLTGGWTVSSATADSETAFTATGTSGEGLYKNFFTVGRRYKVKANWSKTNGSLFLLTNSISAVDTLYSSSATSGTIEHTFVAVRTMLYFRVSGIVDTLTVTNLSIVEL